MAAREASRGLRLQQRLNRTHGKELICPSLCPFLVRPPAARPLSNVFQPLFFLYPSPFSLFLSLSLLRGGPPKDFVDSRKWKRPEWTSLPPRFLKGRRCNTRVKWKWSVIKDVDDRIPPFESSVWLLIKRSDFTFFFFSFSSLSRPLPLLWFYGFFFFSFDGYRAVFVDRMGRWISIVSFPLIFFSRDWIVLVGRFDRFNCSCTRALYCVEFLNFCSICATR